MGPAIERRELRCRAASTYDNRMRHPGACIEHRPRQDSLGHVERGSGDRQGRWPHRESDHRSGKRLQWLPELDATVDGAIDQPTREDVEKDDGSERPPKDERRREVGRRWEAR